MNYNTFSFWAFFFIVLTPYWSLSHRGQNRLLLVASYLFYGFWDYRFLFLILFSSVIDFVGGLGVAGERLERPQLRRLGALVIAAACLLCSGFDIPLLWQSVWNGDRAALWRALPDGVGDLWIPAAVTLLCIGYGRALPRLYGLDEQRRRKVFLVISLVANLALLGFFKYFDFFAATLADALRTMGVSTSSSVLGILLPAGISFYTFQAMSYTIDIYRGQVRPTRDFGDFALFVAFFPHLIAGPIMRAHTLLPQVVQARTVSRTQIRDGIRLIVLGLLRKMVLADNMARIANAVFFRFADGTAQDVTGPEVMVGIYAFALQIYGDFSGYSSIARGLSKLLGFELVVNFAMPYLAQSPSDFWKRWHISLSSWLRDYLYIPLGGNRGGVVKQYRNLTLTMLLGGLWHGASWTFVAWGLYHGFILCLYRVLRLPDVVAPGARGRSLRVLGRVVIMFHLTCLGWLFFRADDFQTVVQMSSRLLTSFAVTPFVSSALAFMAVLAVPLTLVELLVRGEQRLDRVGGWPWALRGLVYSYAVAMIVFFHAEETVEFIYFQF